MIRIRSLTNQAVIADKCFVATRFFDRLRGLIGKKAMPSGEAMLFPSCNDIHMWFMSMPIDVVFLRALNRERSRWTVTSVHRGVRAWKALPLRDGKASDTLELPVGTIDQHVIATGDELCID
jgi:uncharacterized membrane protein (UPF0127 family)